MNTLFRVLLVGIGLVLPANGAMSAAKTQVSLLLSHAGARPGETVTAALRLVSEPSWHTYWRNPGDAGTPTSIEWLLPLGVTAGAIQWPVPEKLVIAGLYDYVYDKETLLLVPLTIAPDAKAGTMDLRANVSWLECSEKACVPRDGLASATLTIGGQSQPSENAALIDQWKTKLPLQNPKLKVAASWENPTASPLKLVLEWVPDREPREPDFYLYETGKAFTNETEKIQATTEKVRLGKLVANAEAALPKQLTALVLDDSKDRKAYEVTFDLPPLPGRASAAPVQLATPAAPLSFLGILGLAFLGGLILNIMPCVLPVIALKILGFVNQSREEPKRIRELGIVYMLGVLASFLVLAAGLLAARQAAGDVNWGMQMQNPYFVVAMTVLVTLVALNLWGVFEITVSGRALGAASELAGREGKSGAFYNGVLATLLATPCTAPALGAAVGAVLTRPAWVVLLTFLMIGFGLALPYVVLSWNPRLLKRLPKPGAWMEKFKMAMGFPMAATAVWLWSFGGRHFGKSGGLWLGLFLVFLALAAWIYGDFVQRGTKRRGLSMALALLVLLIGYIYTLEANLHWRNPQLASASGEELVNEPGGIPWQRWSAEVVAKARADGRPVLVDFTADWCLTCQINKKSSLEIDSVRAKLKEINGVALLADFTLRDPKIGAEIRRFERAGVPLVVVYPPDPSGAPVVLPDGLLTPGIVLKALDLASKGGPGELAKKD